MGGKSSAQKQQEDLSRLQMQQSKELLDFSKQRTAQMDTLLQPLIAFSQMTASGDKGAMNTALAPSISGVTSAYAGSKNNIMDTLAPGAGREFALGQLERDKANNLAQLPNNAYLQSLNTLAQIGSGQGQFGLQQLGAGLRSGEGASQTNSTVMQAEAQKKASQLGLLGSMAGAAGMAMTGGMAGGMAKSGGGGGGGTAMSLAPYFKTITG